MDNGIDDFNYSNRVFKSTLRNSGIKKNSTKKGELDFNPNINLNEYGFERGKYKVVENIDKIIIERNENQENIVKQCLNRYKNTCTITNNTSENNFLNNNKSEKNLSNNSGIPTTTKNKNLSHLINNYKFSSKIDNSEIPNKPTLNENNLKRIDHINGTNPATFLTAEELKTKVKGPPLSKVIAYKGMLNSNEYKSTIGNKFNTEAVNNKINKNDSENLSKFDSNVKKYAFKHHLKTEKNIGMKDILGG